MMGQCRSVEPSVIFANTDDGRKKVHFSVSPQRANKKKVADLLSLGGETVAAWRAEPGQAAGMST